MKAGTAPASSSTVHVVISMHLKEYTGSGNEIDIDAVSTLESLAKALDDRFPGISHRFLDDQGNVRRYVNIFVDGEDIREKQGTHTDLSGAREIVILPSVAGG